MDAGRIACAILVALATVSCSGKSAARFQVLPTKPAYVLRSPLNIDNPLAETLSAVSSLADGQVDLKPQMMFKLENAYFKSGQEKRGLANYLGLESIEFRVAQNGQLQRLEHRVLAKRPNVDPAIDSYLKGPQQRLRFHRLLLQVTMNRKTGEANAVLLSAASAKKLDALKEKLEIDVAIVCSARALNCTVFPSTGSVSLGFEVLVNGKSSFVAWGTTVGAAVGKHSPFSLERIYRKRLAPVEIDGNDPAALRLPLLPGDSVKW